MWFWIILAIVFIGGGKKIGDLVGKSLFPNDTSNSFSNEKESNITINNYTTEQHLHVTENQVKELSKKE